MSAQKAAIYVRVSTMNQVDRDSLKTQEERLSAYAKSLDYKVIKVFKDAGLSGKNTKRPALESLMADVRADKINTILVTKLDRITRSVKDLLKLLEFFKKHETHFVSISENFDTETPMGRFTLTLLGLMAQLEREVTAERVAVDMRHRAKKGKWNGGVVPFGYMTQAQLLKMNLDQGMDEQQAQKDAAKKCPQPKIGYVNEIEAETVRWMFDHFIKYDSIRKTTIELNNTGHRTRKGKLWATSSVHRILSNPTYAGNVWFGKRKTDTTTGKLIPQDKDTWIVADGNHDAIVSDEIFEKARQLMAGKSKCKPKRKGRVYLLSGIVKCGLCGGPLYGYTFQKSKQKAYSYYKCVNKQQKGELACIGQSIPAEKLEGFIIDTLMNLSKDQTFLSDKQKMIEILKGNVTDTKAEAEIDRIESEIASLRTRVDTILQKLEQGLIDDDDFKVRYRDLKDQIKGLESARTKQIEFEDNSQIMMATLETAYDGIEKFDKNWEFLDDVGKSMRVKSVVKEIRATKEAVELDVFLDVEDVSRRDRGSWPPPA
jgi:site-specific DNA recombinase